MPSSTDPRASDPRSSDPRSSDRFGVADLVRPEVIANPYPYYARLREQPVQFGLKDYPPGTVPGRDEPRPAWVFLKYADVVAVAKDHETFSSRDDMQENSSAPTLMLVNHDRPQHTFLRGLAQHAFTPKRVLEDVAPWAERTVADMIERLGDGQQDVMQTYAVELPARFITRLLGTPESDWRRLRDWGNAFMVTSNYTTAEREQSNLEVAAYYADAVDQRVADLQAGRAVGDDLMTALIVTEFEGRRLSIEEVKRFCVTLVVAGAETTVYFLGNLIATFLEEPSLYQRLREDPALIRYFMEESLRRDGPPQRLFRVATRDARVGGAEVRQGDWVAIFFAAANRDPAVFEDPDAFVLKRPNVNRHLTFGHGIHHCLGSRIARLEAQKLIEGLLASFQRIEPGTAAPRRQAGGLLNYGLESCPVNLVR